METKTEPVRNFSLNVPLNEPIDWKDSFCKLKEYSVTLEHTRADLWGVNEDLHAKIKALERGQEDLLIRHECYRRVVHLAKKYAAILCDNAEALSLIHAKKELFDALDEIKGIL